MENRLTWWQSQPRQRFQNYRAKIKSELHNHLTPLRFVTGEYTLFKRRTRASTRQTLGGIWWAGTSTRHPRLARLMELAASQHGGARGIVGEGRQPTWREQSINWKRELIPPSGALSRGGSNSSNGKSCLAPAPQTITPTYRFDRNLVGRTGVPLGPRQGWRPGQFYPLSGRPGPRPKGASRWTRIWYWSWGSALKLINW